MSNLPPIYADLDPKVAPLVEALRRDGWPTTHSCDGHGEYDLPWVTLQYPVSKTARRWAVGSLLDWMVEHNLQGNVSVVHSTEAYRAPGEIPFLKIEVFSDLKDARF
jgi:hypothetical protein